jgi:hypothetical protein
MLQPVTRFALLLILPALVATVPAARAEEDPRPRFLLELEAGPVWQTVNDNQIPNTSEGTRISLVDLAGKGPQFAYRVYLEYRLSSRSSLRGLFAPLSFTEPGVSDVPVDFNGATFAPDQELLATYKFNSYRLSYRYLWKDGARWRWHIGFTAKIRDARVQLQQGDLVSTKDNVGFVPLLHLAARRHLGEKWHLDLDLDALAGGPGRAEDLAIKLGHRPAPGWVVSIGYRMVEGGADVEEVYSFAWLHYLVGSAAVAF